MQLSSELKADIGAAFDGMPYVGELAPRVEWLYVSRRPDKMEPYGDPMNGIRQGRFPGNNVKNIPAAAFVAVFAGTATFVQIASVVAFVGTAMSVVGMVTGNQKLMKIGGILGLAGGIAGLAAGAAGGAGAAVGEGLGGAGGAMGQGGDYGMGAIAEGGATSGLGLEGAGGALGQGGDYGMTDLGAGAMPMTATEAPSLAGAQPPDSGGFLVDQAAAAPTTQAPGIGPKPAGMNVDQVDALAGVNGNSTGMPGSVTGTTPPSPTATGETAAFGNNSYTPGQFGSSPGTAPPPNVGSGGGFFDWLKNLPEAEKSRLMTGALQAGGQAVGGLFAGWSEEQKLAFQQEMWSTQQSNAKAQPSLGTKKSGGLLSASRGVA